jgi:dethiobiotin synthetase
MGKGLFITGTGTDIGKTYVTALLVKALRDAGYAAGYYKAAVSGAPTVAASDAGYVNMIAGIGEAEDMLLSYLYTTAVSPHLASRLEGHPVEKDVIISAYAAAASAYDYVTMEGSGGIVCPLRHDEEAVYYLQDVLQWLQLPSLIIGDAGLGAINAVVLTADYMKHRDLPVRGIILNHYTDSLMERDNITMIEELTGVPVLALIKDGDTILNMNAAKLAALYN